MGKIEGKRLERYVKSRWGSDRRGMVGLAEKMGVSKQTLYVWYRGENDPSLAHLYELAKALGVSRSRILAAMDGEPVVTLDDPETRAAVRDEVRAALLEIADPRSE